MGSATDNPICENVTSHHGGAFFKPIVIIIEFLLDCLQPSKTITGRLHHLPLLGKHHQAIKVSFSINGHRRSTVFTGHKTKSCSHRSKHTHASLSPMSACYKSSMWHGRLNIDQEERICTFGLHISSQLLVQLSARPTTQSEPSPKHTSLISSWCWNHQHIKNSVDTLTCQLT